MKGYHVGDFIYDFYFILLIINCTNSYIGQAFTEGCLKKINNNNWLDKRALWASWCKGAGAQAPSARACLAG